MNLHIERLILRRNKLRIMIISEKEENMTRELCIFKDLLLNF